MKYLDLTLPSPAENLALDEALLDWCEAGQGEETLRVWESDFWFVALGYANSAERAANLAACRARSIPVLRRISGGGAVLQGPGCLSYALVLKISGELGTIRGANRLVLERHRAALQGLRCGEIRHQGDTDLTLGDLKLSGNSQRRKKNWLLFHGTFLLSADLELMEELLPLPSRQPEYRRQRTHREFLTCLGMSPARLKAGLRLAWSATRALQDVPLEQMSCLVREKYSRLEWNLRVS